jgi:transposase
MHSKGAPRRRHSKELKALVLAACEEPGASVAAVAQTHGLNANLVHKWRRDPARRAPARVGSQRPATVADTPSTGDPRLSGFIPLAIPAAPAISPASDIRIELRRGATSIAVSWPTAAAAECAGWMRELLR